MLCAEQWCKFLQPMNTVDLVEYLLQAVLKPAVLVYWEQNSRISYLKLFIPVISKCLQL